MTTATANLSTVYPLPSALQSRPAATRPRRRHRAGSIELDDRRVASFNELLARLDSNSPTYDGDQLASAARDLLAEAPGATGVPASLRQRIGRAAAIARMNADRLWEPANDAGEPARLVVEYVRSGNDLIPDTVPGIGRLDDAIVVDTAWGRLCGEVLDYLDYRRVRRLEAELRGRSDQGFGFTRADWNEARAAEQAWIAHVQQAAQRSYVPRAALYGFRVF